MSNFRSIPPCTLLSPVPAVMVSCQGAEAGAKPNIITVAWAGTVNSTPPMVSISIQKSRASHGMLLSSKEFVVNLVDQAHCRALDYCGVKSARDTDKWADLSLTPLAVPPLTYAPTIAQCPAYLACQVEQVISLGSHDMFLGKVVDVGVQERLFGPDGAMHMEAAGLVGYAHGTYLALGEVLGFFGYSLARPEVMTKRMATYWPILPQEEDAP